jgi:hypothetical protein
MDLNNILGNDGSSPNDIRERDEELADMRMCINLTRRSSSTFISHIGEQTRHLVTTLIIASPSLPLSRMIEEPDSPWRAVGDSTPNPIRYACRPDETCAV